MWPFSKSQSAVAESLLKTVRDVAEKEIVRAKLLVNCLVKKGASIPDGVGQIELCVAGVTFLLHSVKTNSNAIKLESQQSQLDSLLISLFSDFLCQRIGGDFFQTTTIAHMDAFDIFSVGESVATSIELYNYCGRHFPDETGIVMRSLGNWLEAVEDKPAQSMFSTLCLVWSDAMLTQFAARQQ